MSTIGDKISVCLLTYNHVALIESTLRSALDQTINGYELIVSDDCSTDGTWELIQKLAAKYPRIRPVRTPRNMGMPGNANFAVAHSSRPYIALLHHDDLYRKDLLQKWGELMDRFNDVEFVFNAYGGASPECPRHKSLPGGRIDGKWFLEQYLFANWGCQVRGTALIRREAWDSVKGMREEFGLLADVDMWMRLAMRKAVGYVPEPLIATRNQRPDYYPDTYTGKKWHWSRLVCLYKIHAVNRLAYFKLNTVGGWLKWQLFRGKLSLETAKWLGYAIVKKRLEMIRSSHESSTCYDLLPLRAFRAVLRWGYR